MLTKLRLLTCGVRGLGRITWLGSDGWGTRGKRAIPVTRELCSIPATSTASTRRTGMVNKCFPSMAKHQYIVGYRLFTNSCASKWTRSSTSANKRPYYNRERLILCDNGRHVNQHPKSWRQNPSPDLVPWLAAHCSSSAEFVATAPIHPIYVRVVLRSRRA